MSVYSSTSWTFETEVNQQQAQQFSTSEHLQTRGHFAQLLQWRQGTKEAELIWAAPGLGAKLVVSPPTCAGCPFFTNRLIFGEKLQGFQISITLKHGWYTKIIENWSNTSSTTIIAPWRELRCFWRCFFRSRCLNIHHSIYFGGPMLAREYPSDVWDELIIQAATVPASDQWEPIR